MQISEFLLIATSCCIIFYRSVLGQNNEVIKRNSEVAKDNKLTVNFGDLVIEVTPPRGRENIVNTQQIYEKWRNVDDVTYWESIYGSMDDIPEFEDLPDVPGKTVELKYVKEWEDEDTNEKPTKISNKDQSEVSIKKSGDAGDCTKPSTSESLTMTSDSYSDHCERINPIDQMQKLWNRQKRETSESKEEEAETEESPKSNSHRKRKSRTLSLLQSGLGKSLLKSNLRSNYLLNKYGRKIFRPRKDRRGFSTIDDCTDDYDIAGTTRSEKFVDSAINAVELVNTEIAKRSQVVTGKIANAARQLSQAKHDAINLDNRATQAIVLGSLNNAARDCRVEGNGAIVATNIDGLEVVGNSVLDTKSGIINANRGISVGITTSLDEKTNSGIDTMMGSVVDNNDLDIVEMISGRVAETTSSNLENGFGVMSDTETPIGAALQLNAKSGVHESHNEEISTGCNADINVGKIHKYDHTRRILGSEDLSPEIVTSLEDDQEFYLGHRYRDEFEDERKYGQRFLDRSQYKPYSRDYYERHKTRIHEDTRTHSLLDSGIGVNDNLGSIDTGILSSLGLDSEQNTGRSRSSRIHGDSDVHSLLDTGMNIGGTRSNYRTYGYDRDRLRHREDFDSDDDTCDYDSEEYREYKRRFPDHRTVHNSRIDPNTGSHASLDKSVGVNTGIRGNVINSGIHAHSGIHSSLDTGVGMNANVADGHLNAGKRASLNANSPLDIENAKSRRLDEIYRGYERGEDIFAEYEDYDDEREYERFLVGRYTDMHSGIRAASGIHTPLDTERDIKGSSGSGLQAAAKSSLNRDSHFDIDRNGLAVNGVNPLHIPNTINSAVHTDAGLDTSFDNKLGINVDGRLDNGIESSMDLDSHLDIGTRTNGASGADRRSRIKENVNGSDGKLGAKIRETGCQETTDCRLHEYEQTGQDGSSYMCDDCRRRFYSGTDIFCPNCELQNDIFGERRPFSSRGNIHHFDNLKQNYKRTVDPSDGIESCSKHTCYCNRYINLDANCSDEAFRQSPDCQSLDCNLQTPRDGNPVPLGFVRSHLSHGHDIALDMHDRARSLVAEGLHPRPHTPSMLHFFHSKVPDDLVKLNEESELTLFGTKLLQHKLSVDYNVTPNNFLEFLNHHGLRVTGNGICRNRQKRCGGYDKFQSLDGSCNNVAHPTWGQSNRAFARILPARYSDGIHRMPVSVTGAELPNPRKLSVRLYSRSNKLDPELTLAVVQWGQTLAHDLARQIMDQTTKGGIECCANNGKRNLPKSLQHHSCAPITISPRDKFYSSHGQQCMNFVRAMTICREDCTLGPADQLNGATSYLDCSAMYGAEKATSNDLREFTGGRMKVEFRNGRWMLPTMANHSIFCDIWSSDDICYRTGDPRNNQNPQLVILQTMLVREHNRIADELTALNPQWNDERIFQESRRIVIAEYQHITYNEWLPLLLGRRYAKKHGLIRTEPRMSNSYNERVNPTTIIGFTSGAFRSLHSMIDGDVGLCNVEGDVINSLRLSDHFFRPRVIEKNNNFEHLLRGFVSQRMQMQDMNLHTELTEYLFRSRNVYGMDLAAIDIQRGRDHGVPGYNAYRKICQLKPAKDFDDLSKEISWENIEKLRRYYAHVDDIDLIVGATMENRASGSKFGPINRCLIGEQFYRSRVGDRYFYDNANLPHSFTPEQFHEITKVTLSRLMCDMGGAIDVVQRNAFRAVSPKNSLVPCTDFPKLNLTFWIE